MVKSKYHGNFCKAQHWIFKKYEQIQCCVFFLLRNSSLIIGMPKNSMKQNGKHFMHLDIIKTATCNLIFFLVKIQKQQSNLHFKRIALVLKKVILYQETMNMNILRKNIFITCICFSLQAHL